MGKKSLRHLTTCLLQGMTRGVQKVVNYNKIEVDTQGENENPALFWGRLAEAFKNFTQEYLKNMEARVLLAHSFITQAAPMSKREFTSLPSTCRVTQGLKRVIWISPFAGVSRAAENHQSRSPRTNAEGAGVGVFISLPLGQYGNSPSQCPSSLQ